MLTLVSNTNAGSLFLYLTFETMPNVNMTMSLWILAVVTSIIHDNICEKPLTVWQP